MSLSVISTASKENSLTRFNKMLESTKFADEQIIFAMYKPTPELISLAKKYHAKLIEIPVPKVVEVVRAKQVKAASRDWVLILDFDEIVTSELKGEINAVSKEVESAYSAYAIRRKNYSLGRSLTHGGWGDDYVVRLIKKSEFLSWPTDIHSTPIFKGKVGKLSSHMEHHKDESLEEMVVKTNRYSAVEADQFYEGNLSPVRSLTLLRKLNMEMFRRGVLKLGILDGAIGIIQSIYQGFSVFISYAKLYEKQHEK